MHSYRLNDEQEERQWRDPTLEHPLSHRRPPPPPVHSTPAIQSIFCFIHAVQKHFTLYLLLLQVLLWETWLLSLYADDVHVYLYNIHESGSFFETKTQTPLAGPPNFKQVGHSFRSLLVSSSYDCRLKSNRIYLKTNFNFLAKLLYSFL